MHGNKPLEEEVWPLSAVGEAIADLVKDRSKMAGELPGDVWAREEEEAHEGKRPDWQVERGRVANRVLLGVIMDREGSVRGS